MTRSPEAAAERARLCSLLEELAARAQTFRFEVAPNPCVGAAVLAGERVIGEGFHEFWGGPHAELGALRAAEASGVPAEEWDTLVVTLEPCSSVGKTPACTSAIIDSPVRRVVVGVEDPDPRHRGVGAELLAGAGRDVLLLGGHRLSLGQVCTHFLDWLHVDRARRPRPWTIAKWAQTSTGQLQPPPDVGEGRWISGSESRAEVQRLRSRVDAVLVGVETLRADDPRLTARAPGADFGRPLRVVLDSELRTPADSRSLWPEGPGEAGGPLVLLCRAGASPARHRALIAAGAEVHGLRVDEEGRPDLRAVQGWLWERGVRRLLVEAGPTLQSAFLRRGLVDQLRLYSGSVESGRGPTLVEELRGTRLREKLERELEHDQVLEAFVSQDP